MWCHLSVIPSSPDVNKCDAHYTEILKIVFNIVTCLHLLQCPYKQISLILQALASITFNDSDYTKVPAGQVSFYWRTNMVIRTIIVKVYCILLPITSQKCALPCKLSEPSLYSEPQQKQHGCVITSQLFLSLTTRCVFHIPIPQKCHLVSHKQRSLS